MATLLEKIAASASDRLVLPPRRQPSEELTRYKKFLKVESHRLRILHRGGGGGKEVCAARAHMLDHLLRHILEAVQANVEQPSASPPRLALVAIGGYGRAELNPQSDIDIMFLHDGALAGRGQPASYLRSLADGLLYTLWDIGLKVGHSVRTVADCVKIANQDVQSKTALIEARLVTGDQGLFQSFQKTLLARCVKGHEDAYVAARLADQTARRDKFGNSAALQEPNVKNGCGGLRDFQNLLWMAFFKYRTRSLEDLEARGFLARGERKQLETAYDFLLRVRTELHYQANRAVDVVGKERQPAVALHLGYSARPVWKRIELFMSDLYAHLRNIHLITRTLEQRLALLPQPDRFPSFREILRSRRERARQRIVDGFKIIDGQIHPGSSRVFRDQPRRLMRVFLHLQQRNLRLHPDLAQLIRNQLPLVNRTFLTDPHVRETFLEILNQPGNVAPILRAMHEVGLLGKYLPEFGRLTCRVQHEFYHQYAADEHTLVCLEKLDTVWDASESPFSHYTPLFETVGRPFVLYLALLLHDAGKAYPSGPHAEIGSQLSLKVAARLDLDEVQTHVLQLLIRHHLLMARISQRRDLEDPDVIDQFAQQVETPENLVLLTLHTFADSTGTSDKLWNGFKDTLLLTLYEKTRQVLTGEGAPSQADEKQQEWQAEEVRRLLPSTFGDEEFQAHFALLPPRYFNVHSPAEIAGDLARAHRFMHLQLTEQEQALVPIVTWHNEPDRGYSAVYICTWNRSGLFSRIAGSLTAAGLNILSAQVFTRSDEIIFDTFFVTDARTGNLASRDQRETFEGILEQALTGKANFKSLFARRKKELPPPSLPEEDRLPTQIEFDNETSAQHTVIEVETEDRVGLLYVISRLLSAAGLDIALAKISTGKGAAVDTFYVNHVGGDKVLSPERQAQIQSRLQTAIASLDKF